MTDIKVSKKICLIGDFGVGKTSLVRRFVDGAFSDQYLTTIGVKISRKTVELDSQSRQSIQLLIWDLEGSSKFKGISETHLQGASGAIIVADLTRNDTVKHLEDHVSTFLRINPKGAIVIALNKADLMGEEEVAQIQKNLLLVGVNGVFNNSVKILGVYPTSAKTGTSVNQIFALLAHKIIT
jgi:small GTP-binding protein